MASYLIEKNALKLIYDDQDFERAFLELEKFGLKEKLIQFSGRENQAYSLAWWLSKEPLSSVPTKKQKKGRTAQELGISTVTHATKSLEVIESIAANPIGKPNVFISRKSVEGERATFGSGFYTVRGDKPDKGYGEFVIRFEVAPDATEGVHFKYVAERNFVIWMDSSKLTLIRDSVDYRNINIFDFLLSIDPRQTTYEKNVLKALTRKILDNWNDKLEAEFIKRADEEFHNTTETERSLSIFTFSGPTKRYIDRFIENDPNRAIESALKTVFYSSLLEKKRNASDLPSNLAGILMDRLKSNWNPKLSKLFIEKGISFVETIDAHIIHLLPDFYKSYFQKEIEILLEHFAEKYPMVMLNAIYRFDTSYDSTLEMQHTLARIFKRKWTEEIKNKIINDFRNAIPEERYYIFPTPFIDESNIALDEFISKDPKAALEMLFDPKLEDKIGFRRALTRRLLLVCTPELETLFLSRTQSLLNEISRMNLVLLMPLPIFNLYPELLHKAYAKATSLKVSLKYNWTRFTNKFRSSYSVPANLRDTFFYYLLNTPESLNSPELRPFIKKLLFSNDVYIFYTDFLKMKESLQFADLFIEYLDKSKDPDLYAFASHFFSKPFSVNQNLLLKKIIEKYSGNDRRMYILANEVFSKDFHADKLEELALFVAKVTEPYVISQIQEYVFENGPFANSPYRPLFEEALQIENPIERLDYLHEAGLMDIKNKPSFCEEPLIPATW